MTENITSNSVIKGKEKDGIYEKELPDSDDFVDDEALKGVEKK